MNKHFLRFTFFLLISLTLPLPATAQVIDIPDPNLRAAVEKTLGKASGVIITAADMARLTRLEATNANISDLTGLEHATNLTELFLGDEYVEAEDRWLNSNSVTDLSPLAELTSLIRLELRNNNISNISAVAGLTNLILLDLNNNNISDISALEGLTNLTWLNLWHNNISDISALVDLTSLTELFLGGNTISDISVLAGLTQLERLELWGNSTTDISSVAGLTNLTSLGLNDNNISDISYLAANTGLGNGDTVNVKYNPLNYTSIKTHIPALQSRGVTVEFDNRTPAILLAISGVITESNNLLIVEVRDSNGLAFEGVPVTFTVTSGGGTLSTTRTTTNENGRAESRLTLGYNGNANTVRASVEGISEPVDFSDATVNIPDLNLRAAIEQALGKTPGTPIAPSEMAALTRLEARNANISDLTGLEAATNLRELNLGRNLVSDLSPLVGLIRLMWIRLVSNNISDLSPLVANRGLESGDQVLLNGNPLSYTSIKTHIPILQNRGVTIESDNRTPATLLNISGVITELDNLLIVEVRDSNNLAFEGVPITFTVTSGGGTLSTTRTITDENGRAQSRFTLGFDGGTSTVRASVEGISASVTFSDIAADIPDLNLRAAIENALGKVEGKPIAPSEMATLTRLEAQNANISDLTGLEAATNLRELNLGRNSVSDLSPLAGLTRLTWIRLVSNNISDLSPLVANSGLGSGDQVLLNDNPLSSLSINTYIPILQSRGVKVGFDDKTHLNIGEPRTVRMIYFLPNDRPYRAAVEQRAKDHVRKSQIFFAEQMRAHGYGNKTFRVETDSDGEPMVHQVAGQYPNSHYFHYMQNKVLDEVGHTFDLNSNLYYIVLGTDGGFRRNDGQAGGGTGQRWGKVGGFVMVSDGLDFELTAHELGHAFGLSHDFRDGSYIMSYGPGHNQLSACHAEYLSMNPYFNPDVPLEMRQPPTTELISSHTYPAGAKSVPIRLKISDSDGLHQVILFAITSKLHPAGRDFEVKACRSLGGKKETIVEFNYDGIIPSDDSTNLSNSLVHELFVQAVDMKGNMVIEREVRPSFTLLSDAPQPLSKISGDNQHGLPNTPLPVPFVVEVRDLKDGFVRAGEVVTFVVTAGDGTLSVTHATTDKNGRAESTLTLGPNLGTNTVEVSVAGIEGTVTFNAVAETAVNIPDPNLRAAIETTLGKASGAPITASEMEILIRLEVPEAGISNLTGLEYATNLQKLNLRKNTVSDLSPVAGLIHLTWLKLSDNSISDISAVAGLTNLMQLFLDGNSISDISAVTGLTDLIWLDLSYNPVFDLSPLVANTGLGDGDRVRLGGNPLNSLSIHTHIPTLQERGVWIWFPETELLQNYPNPFTPETWIPYRLAEEASVTLTIYDLSGHVVRTFNVGHRIAAVYESESKAIYWSGRNDLGERVASGVYFYTLTAGDYSATRKMVMLK